MEYQLKHKGLFAQKVFEFYSVSALKTILQSLSSFCLLYRRSGCFFLLATLRYLQGVLVAPKDQSNLKDVLKKELGTFKAISENFAFRLLFDFR
jgi:hypothetical protein